MRGTVICVSRPLEGGGEICGNERRYGPGKSRVNLVAIALIVLAGLLPAACWQEEMRNQRKYEAYEAAPGAENGMSARMPPAGTVAREDLVAPRPPNPAVDMALLQQGRESYEATCAPCHGLTGDGRGMVVQRGFPSPPSFHTERLREARDAHFYDVMSNGFGLMYPYANRVRPDERWAVTAYIRALQASQHADVATLPEDLRRALQTSGRDAE